MSSLIWIIYRDNEDLHSMQFKNLVRYTDGSSETYWGSA